MGNNIVGVGLLIIGGQSKDINIGEYLIIGMLFAILNILSIMFLSIRKTSL